MGPTCAGAVAGRTTVSLFIPIRAEYIGEINSEIAMRRSLERLPRLFESSNNPAIQGSMGSLSASPCRQSLSGRDDSCPKPTLRKVLFIQRGNKVSPTVLCASTDGVVSWIRGHLLNGRHIDLLCFFAQQIDDSANELRTHAKTCKNGLVFSDDIGADEPGEVTFLDPSSKQLCTRVCDLRFWFETGNAGHKHRGVDDPSTRVWLLLPRQPSSPVRISWPDAGSLRPGEYPLR